MGSPLKRDVEEAAFMVDDRDSERQSIRRAPENPSVQFAQHAQQTGFMYGLPPVASLNDDARFGVGLTMPGTARPLGAHEPKCLAETMEPVPRSRP
jgi:hypothetical protein